MLNGASQPVGHGDTHTAEPPSRTKVVSRERRKNRERPDLRRQAIRHMLELSARGSAQEVPGVGVAAMHCAVYKGPQRPGRLCLGGISPKQSSTGAEQYAPP